MDILSALNQVELFAHSSPEARNALAAVARTCIYDGDQIITVEGEPDVPVSYVLRGAVRVFRTGLDGREQTVIRLGPGAAFNMPAAFAGDGSAPASVAAVGEVELLSIPGEDFRRIVSQTPEISLAVLRDLSTKLHYLTDLTRDLGLLTVRARLARFLLNAVPSERGAVSSASGVEGHSQGAHPVRWTHYEIAAQIGTVREVVSRTLRAFVRDDLIKLDRHRIVVLDREALTHEAEL